MVSYIQYHGSDLHVGGVIFHLLVHPIWRKSGSNCCVCIADTIVQYLNGRAMYQETSFGTKKSDKRAGRSHP